LGVSFGRAIRYIFFVAEKATKKDTAPIPNATRVNKKFISLIKFKKVISLQESILNGIKDNSIRIFVKV
jgi:hypothetical protein